MHISKSSKKSKRENIVETAIKLFNDYGTKKITVEEICKQSKTSKGTFYKNFTSKTDLIIKICTKFASEQNDYFNNYLTEDMDFETLVKSVLELKQFYMKKYSHKFLVDLYNSEVLEVQSILEKMKNDTINNSLKLYHLGIKQDKINSEITAEFFLYLIEVVHNTFNDDKVIKMYPDPNKRNLIIFEQFFYGLVKKD